MTERHTARRYDLQLPIIIAYLQPVGEDTAVISSDSEVERHSKESKTRDLGHRSTALSAIGS